MNSLRVAISPCPNDIFVFAAWIKGLVAWKGPTLGLEFHDIQTLNEIGASDARPDVLKFSFAAWQGLNKYYDLSDVGAALGHGVGPLVVGKKVQPLHLYKEILIPGLNTTAALLWKRYGHANLQVKVMRYDKILLAVSSNDALAGVLIHESRFTYKQHGLHMLLDLGMEWESELKMPLPLGGIGLQKNLDKKMKKEIEQAIRSSLDFASKHPEKVMDLVKHHAQEMDPVVMTDHIQLYVNEFTRSLGDKGLHSVNALCFPKEC